MREHTEIFLPDHRNEEQIVTDLAKLAHENEPCRHNNPDCLYWCFASCSHSHHRCTFVSRKQRGIGPALGVGLL